MWMKVNKCDASLVVAFVVGLDDIYVYSGNYAD